MTSSVALINNSNLYSKRIFVISNVRELILIGSYVSDTLVNKLLHELAYLILTIVVKIYGIIALIQKEIPELNLKKLHPRDVN